MRPSRQHVSDRAVRSLANISSGGSTGRCLNLVDVWLRHGGSEEYLAAPLFKSRLLNKSIIVKHRLRKNEEEIFNYERRVATKIIIPFDSQNLKSGGQSVFFGEPNFERFVAANGLNSDETVHHDHEVLTLLDGLPSLDPFIVRERLRVSGYSPSPVYFNLSEAEARAMFGFVQSELSLLAKRAVESGDDLCPEQASKLTRKLLDNKIDDSLSLLRVCIGLNPQNFEESIFGWKGFLYYKWSLGCLLQKVRPFTQTLFSPSRFYGMGSGEVRQIQAQAHQIVSKIIEITQEISNILSIYDDAYRELTCESKVKGFREFLYNAPRMFDQLGSKIGAIQEIMSYWQYRRKQERLERISTEEYLDIVAEFMEMLEACSDGDDPSALSEARFGAFRLQAA